MTKDRVDRKKEDLQGPDGGGAAGPLAEAPFSYRQSGTDKIFLYHQGRHVVTLAGRKASTFLSRVMSADTMEAQRLMARATGNFKRGNERPPGRAAGRG